jgi:hopanoid biosynthesis associated RND transporter like protein HpnN
MFFVMGYNNQKICFQRIALIVNRARTYSTGLLEWWANSVRRHAVLAVFITFLATVGVLAYTINHFRIDTELTEMISDRLPYRKMEREFQKAFPQLANTIVVVIDAETPEAARFQRKRMAERLKGEVGLFKRVYLPGGGEFFEKNGLLYLTVKDLQELADNLAGAQPLLGFISRDLSLRGLFSLLEKILGQEGEREERERLVPLFDRLRKAFESTASNQSYQLSWQELIVGKEAAREMSRQFIILEPMLDGDTLAPGEASLEAVQHIRDQLGLRGGNGVTVRLTGDIALHYENLLTVKSGMGLITLVSFILVAIALAIGLGSGRLVFASLVTLLVGLIWTLGFAIVFIGHLNLISVSFAVLFIGLGIDYGIQFCLRYREEMVSGLGHDEAIVRTAKGLGVSLRLCSVAAAIGFYSFLPTAYTGVSELGLIAGTGMLINLFATLTVLPALLTLMPLKKDRLKEFKSDRSLYLVPNKYSKTICYSAIVVGIGAALFLPRIAFDYNPLNLYSPHSEAVSTIKDLFQHQRTTPWTISVLAKNAQEAREIAGRLKRLKEVDEAITLLDFVPDHQSKKLGILSDIALFMPPGLGTWKSEKLSYEEKMKSLINFEAALKHFLSRFSKESGEDIASVKRLYDALESFKTALGDPGKGKRVLDRLENSLVGNLPVLLDDLRLSLQARQIRESDLPQELSTQYVTPEGRYRIEVFPHENILKMGALERFADAVAAVAPRATDTPIVIREAGKAVVRSFLQATIYAIIAITLYLLIELRSVSDTGLTLLPLTLSLLLTGAGSVILDLPFNFANVIVVPLLIGSSIEGAYLVYRFRTEPPMTSSVLKTSTARALFFSMLTTILSFSTLSFSPHRGMASMGKLLTVCIGSLMVTTLLLLPALFSFKSRLQNPEP